MDTKDKKELLAQMIAGFNAQGGQMGGKNGLLMDTPFTKKHMKEMMNQSVYDVYTKDSKALDPTLARNTMMQGFGNVF